MARRGSIVSTRRALRAAVTLVIVAGLALANVDRCPCKPQGSRCRSEAAAADSTAAPPSRASDDAIGVPCPCCQDHAAPTRDTATFTTTDSVTLVAGADAPTAATLGLVNTVEIIAARLRSPFRLVVPPLTILRI